MPPTKPNDPTNVDEAPPPPNFTFFLSRLANGEADANAAYEMQQLTMRLQEEAHARNGKVKGKFKLVINFIVDETDAVAIHYDISTAAPPRKTTPSISWLKKNGQLTDRNPRQQEIPGLRDVGGGKKEFRNVTAPDAGAPREV